MYKIDTSIGQFQVTKTMNNLCFKLKILKNYDENEHICEQNQRRLEIRCNDPPRRHIWTMQI